MISYDANGNITNLKTNQKGYNGFAEEIDDLIYSYQDTNRLGSVTDLKNNYSGYPDTSGNTISYDNNGNMTSHIDKGVLEIKYNDLNQPSYIKFNNFVSRAGGDIYRNLSYSYRADGVKIKKTHHYFSGRKQNDAFTTTEYVDGFQYKNETALILTNNGLQFFATSEGYFDFENNRYIYHYNDHLGNVRVSFTREGNTAVIVQQNDYYALGLRHREGINFGGSYKYEYNGKELQEEIGMYDYGARFYMPDLGRWGVTDPLAEYTPHLSPYHYGNNNPIMYNDPTGMVSQSFMDQVLGSPSGTTWTNTGSGFTNNWGGTMDFEGNSQNYTPYKNYSYIDAGGSSGGGGDVAGEILLPALSIRGNFWTLASTAFFHQNSFMARWNAKSDFYWDRMLNAGRYNDGPVKMIGGINDPLGLFDIGGQVISNWEPENRHLAMGVGIVGALAMKKPGLAAKTEGNLALGLREDLFAFAKTKNFDTYKTFSTGFQQEKILNALHSYENLHFNVTGFSKYQFSKFKPGGIVTGNNITNWEMHEVFNNPSILSKTLFYRKVGNNYQILPNFSPYAY
ncbi:RHS repeat domain-containing protein [Chryseobacterium luquanense]|uniref:RHS repeat-associated core domain-containing protein n=1 Tax=Chryseobacterium luquanense TaxID=2983766 RepID=A0ABT3Y1E9_9FLAO|nr:RHS repeat-associated core domain-containing protein [Chryseobacterium luquanense]MCX8531932.1 RHS repeat-associated core domain-containing protein [Chryseobacterium luquanense]